MHKNDSSPAFLSTMNRDQTALSTIDPDQPSTATGSTETNTVSLQTIDSDSLTTAKGGTAGTDYTHQIKTDGQDYLADSKTLSDSMKKWDEVGVAKNTVRQMVDLTKMGGDLLSPFGGLIKSVTGL